MSDIICSIAPLTQAGINPARDLSPRIFAWLVGWGAAAFPDPPWAALVVYDIEPYNLPCSSCESPFVMKHGEWYYLAFSYVDYGKYMLESYDNTLMFRSLRPNDPTAFGDWGGDPEMVVTRLAAHASEFVQDPDQGNAWLVTTCGWPKYPNPHPGAASIAPLEWDPVEE